MKPTKIRRVPIIDGIPLTRIHELKCLCGHKFNVDLGARGMDPGTVIKCPECGTPLGKMEEVLFKRWETV